MFIKHGEGRLMNLKDIAGITLIVASIIGFVSLISIMVISMPVPVPVLNNPWAYGGAYGPYSSFLFPAWTASTMAFLAVVGIALVKEGSSPKEAKEELSSEEMRIIKDL
jgi:hypothetical protein